MTERPGTSARVPCPAGPSPSRNRHVTQPTHRGSERPMPRDVAELVAAAKDGDREAFDELVRATYADTYTLAYRMTGNEEDARDVVQEAYLRAYRGLRRFRGDALFSTWMYRITANCSATQLGRRARHRHDELDDTAPVADHRADNDPQLPAEGDALLSRTQRRHVERCLRCQAEIVQYRRLLRAMHTMRTEVLEPAPGLLADILATIESAGERHAIRSMLSGRRVAYLGGLAAATAAGAAGAIAFATRTRRARLAG